MKIINWNISWSNKIDGKAGYLRGLIEGDSFIVILQEVKQYAYEFLVESLGNIANIVYSLNYRVPGKYDTDSRKLGVAVLISKDFRITNAQVIDRALMPDRTMLVDIEKGTQRLRVLGLHSITGCHHLKAKEIQYFSFAEAIDKYKPDIVGIDANEPQYDHYEISKMRFFDNYNKGNGCKTFFETMQINGMADAFVKDYKIDEYEEGKYLATSHIIKRGKKKVRYDFLFIKEDKFREYQCKYDYENAVKAGSDHATVIVELK